MYTLSRDCNLQSKAFFQMHTQYHNLQTSDIDGMWKMSVKRQDKVFVKNYITNSFFNPSKNRCECTSMWTAKGEREP